MKRKWLYICIAALLVVVVGLVAYPRVKEGIAYVRGMEAYAYRFPLVITELTRQVETATPMAGELAAPINQFSRVRGYIPWDFVNVVRVSFNSLWSWACIDLQ